ncbi:MAG: ABC transporter permease [Lachnospiraceae bacterium]|nr:ABC transporter permease [Lachnospiraceae bacterium]
MIFYMIKNNIKLMLRSPLTILIYVLGPTLVASILISAFNSFMKSYEGVDKFKAAYRLEEGSAFEKGIDLIKENFEENGITLVEYKEGDPEELIRKNDLAGFVDFSKDGYTVYEIKDSKLQGYILEYLITQVSEEATDAAYMNALGMPSVRTGGEKAALNTEHPEFVPAIDSADYYGIIEIVYFASFSIVCGAAFLSQEKKNRIGRRFMVSNISNTKIYLAKLLSVTGAVSVGLILSVIILVAFSGVKWGDPVLSAVIILMLILGTLAMELMVFSLTDNVAATVIITFTIIWLMGFFGGSFETYMFSSHSRLLKNLSPIYYANRSLVELSCMGHSDYIVRSLGISASMCVVFTALAVLICKVRREKA